MADATRSSRAPRAARGRSTRPAATRSTTTRGAATRRSPSGRSTKGGSRANSRRPAATRTTPSARIADRLRSRLALGALVTVIAAAIVATLVVLPVRTWLDQRDELEVKQDELTTLERANEALDDDIARLQTPEGIEDAARVELGYQMAGETRVASNEAPSAPVDLPAGWPYSTVEQILAVRRGGG